MTDKGTRADQAARAQKLRGLAYVVFDKKRGYYWRSWPAPRGAAKSVKQQAAEQAMATAAYIVKRSVTWEIESAKDATKGTAWTWKDFAISALYGRAIEVDFKDGTVWRSLRVMSFEIQVALDTITVQTGSMLVRTSAGWVEIPKGSAGQLLQVPNSGEAPAFGDLATQAVLDGISDAIGAILYRSPDGWVALDPATAADNDAILWDEATSRPKWGAVAGGGGSSTGAPQISPLATATFSPNFLVLMPMSLVAGEIVSGAMAFVRSASASSHITPAIYDTSGNTAGNLLRAGPTATGAAAGFNYYPFSTAYTVPANGIYWVGIILTVQQLLTAQVNGFSSYASHSTDTWPSTAPALSNGAPPTWSIWKY